MQDHRELVDDEGFVKIYRERDGRDVAFVLEIPDLPEFQMQGTIATLKDARRRRAVLERRMFEWIGVGDAGGAREDTVVCRRTPRRMSAAAVHEVLEENVARESRIYPVLAAIVACLGELERGAGGRQVPRGRREADELIEELFGAAEEFTRGLS